MEKVLVESPLKALLNSSRPQSSASKVDVLNKLLHRYFIYLSQII